MDFLAHPAVLVEVGERAAQHVLVRFLQRQDLGLDERTDLVDEGLYVVWHVELVGQVLGRG